MADSQDALLSTVVVDTLAAAAVIGVFWLAILWMRGFGKKVGYSLAPLGFSRPRGGILAGIGAGMAVGVGIVLLSMIVNPISFLVLERLGYSTESTIQKPFMQGLVRWVQESPGAAIPAIVLVVVLFGPAVEELIFRGAIFNGLYRLGAVFLPLLLILAITLCALFQRTGSLLPPFVAHATFNSFVAALIILRGLNVLNIHL